MNDSPDTTTAPPPTTADASGRAFYRPHTDLGNAERLLDLEGENLIYVPGPGWHQHDGNRWKRDEDGAIHRAAKRAVRRTRDLADAVLDAVERGEDVKQADVDSAEALKAHARTSEKRSALQSAIDLARSDLRVVRSLDQLDADAFLLNCANGTVDLRTGELRAPSRDDLITKFSPVVYDPTAADPVWTNVLNWYAQDGGPEYIAFLQHWCGYGSTGDVREDLALLFDGPGGTGKSTFADSVSCALGDYAAVAPFSMFVARRGDEGHSTSLAALAGARFVTSEEGPKNRNLDAAKIKTLVGGTQVTARFMRQDEFTYRPQLKLTLITNYRPKVHAEDTGAWRRLRAAPFTHRLPAESRDQRLRLYLQTDPGAQQAILAWVVAGAVSWWSDYAAHGRALPIPECVDQRTQEWRRDSDRVGAWIEDECELEPAAWESSTNLQESINEWWRTYVTDDPGWHAPSLMAGLGDELKTRGCLPERAADAEATRGWRGIRLRNGQPAASMARAMQNHWERS
jgi:putative DNA primase/helicase